MVNIRYGPSLIHFQKDAFIFPRFVSEMCSFQPNIRNLNAIGTDQDIAIYRGFATQIPDLKLLLCAYHLQKNDAQKIRELVRQKGGLRNIICDIYGRNYGGVKELGLVDSTDIDDFRIKLESLKSVWDNLCPGFRKWFSKNRASFFEQSVIESARTGTEVQGVYYNNSIESQHFREKMEQSYKKGTVEAVISTLKKLVERQEVRAIYGSGPYRLSAKYAKFLMDSMKWHALGAEKRRKHVSLFRQHMPTMEQEFKKPPKSLQKSSLKEFRKMRKEQESIIQIFNRKFHTFYFSDL